MEKVELKKLGAKNLLLLLIAGIILLICSFPNLFRTGREDTEKQSAGADATVERHLSLTDEERLEVLLSNVEGVGRVETMIFLQPSGAGDIEGIVVVAEGASSGKTASYILDATEALFGIPKHKIIVLPMKNNNGSD